MKITQYRGYMFVYMYIYVYMYVYVRGSAQEGSVLLLRNAAPVSPEASWPAARPQR